MDDMHIGDFDEGDDISKSVYQNDANTLKIDKLNNRVTIISIIIPCLIGAILFFAYLDIKERVVSVDSSKAEDVKQLDEKLDEKFNSLEVKIAENKYALDKKLPEITSRITAVEGRLAKLDSSKAGKENMEKRLSKMDKVISNNSNQYKGLLHTMERINKKTLSIVNEIDDELKKDITELSEQMDKKMAGIQDYKEELDTLSEEVAELNRKTQEIEESSPDKSVIRNEIGDIEKGILKKIDQLDVKFDKKILEIRKRVEYVDLLNSAKGNKVKKPDSSLKEKGPEPVIEQEEETGDDGEIKEKTLNQ
ncbi:MAG: hypothetical protein R6V41_10105 [Desulfobacteraceae bacterium]